MNSKQPLLTPTDPYWTGGVVGVSRGISPKAYNGPVLSVFSGIDLLGMAFAAEGFCVVSAGDKIFGQDVREFHPPAGCFAGVIGGPPCQDFSAARRGAPIFDGYGAAMLREFARIIEESQPDWFLMENVARVPSIAVLGYRQQRIDLDARECGSAQRRLRHFQWGSRHGLVLTVTRQAVTHRGEATCTATEGRRAGKRGWPAFCALQGLPEAFLLPSFTRRAAYEAVGNGVPLEMGRAVARAVKAARPWTALRLCACTCGREVTGKQILATAACRQRVSRAARRDAARSPSAGAVTQKDIFAEISRQEKDKSRD